MTGYDHVGEVFPFLLSTFGLACSDHDLLGLPSARRRRNGHWLLICPNIGGAVSIEDLIHPLAHRIAFI